MCWLFHKWGRWGEIIKVLHCNLAELVQRRECARCGQIDQRTLGYGVEHENETSDA